MTAAVPETLKAEFQDQMVRIFAERATSGNLTMALDFAARLDPDVLRTAVRRLQDAEPILGCRMDMSGAEPVWRRRADLDANPGFRFDRDVADLDDATAAVTFEPFDVDNEPNLSCILLRGSEADRLLVRVSHVVADGGATFEVAMRLAALYTGISADPGFRLEPNPASRDSFAWLKPFGLRDRMRILRRDIGDILRSRRRHAGFRMTDPKDLERPGTRPFHVFHEVGRERLAELDQLAGARGLMRNDLLLAGFARAFSRLSRAASAESVHLLVPNNLRRFAEVETRPAICNLGGVANVFVEPDLGADYAATLDRVAREMERQRAGFMGAGNPLSLKLLARMPFRRKAATIDRMMHGAVGRSVPPVFTNVGALSERRLRFAGAAPERVRLYCHPARLPLVVVALVEYRHVLVLGCCNYGSDIEPERMRALLRDTVDGIAG